MVDSAHIIDDLERRLNWYRKRYWGSMALIPFGAGLLLGLLVGLWI